MIIDIERLEQAGFEVTTHDGRIEITNMSCSDETLARALHETLDLPMREKELLIEETVQKANNIRIMQVINDCY